MQMEKERCCVNQGPFFGRGAEKRMFNTSELFPAYLSSVLLETLPRDPVVGSGIFGDPLLLSGHLASLALSQAGPSPSGAVVMGHSKVAHVGDAGCVHGWAG